MTERLHSDLIDLYLSYISSTEHRPSTVRTTESTVTQCLEDIIAKFPTTKVTDERLIGFTPKILYAWYATLTDQKMSTKNLKVIMLNGFFRFCYSLNEVGKPPVLENDLAGKLKTGRVERNEDLPPEMQKQRVYTKEQIIRIIEDCPGKNVTRDRAILAMLAGTGLRAFELCSLNIEDGDRIVNERTFRVQRKGGKWAVLEVPEYVVPYLADWLKKHRRRDGWKNMTEEERANYVTTPLFPSVRGNRMTPNSLWHTLSFKEKALDMPTGIHNFRHTLLSNIENAAVARDIASHRSLSVTSRYIHTTSDERRDAVNAVPWAAELAR